MAEYRPRNPEVVVALLQEHGEPYDETFAAETADLVNSLRAQGADGFQFEGPDAIRNAILTGTKIAIATFRKEGLLPKNGQDIYNASSAFFDTIVER